MPTISTNHTSGVRFPAYYNAARRIPLVARSNNDSPLPLRLQTCLATSTFFPQLVAYLCATGYISSATLIDVTSAYARDDALVVAVVFYRDRTFFLATMTSARTTEVWPRGKGAPMSQGSSLRRDETGPKISGSIDLSKAAVRQLPQTDPDAQRLNSPLELGLPPGEENKRQIRNGLALLLEAYSCAVALGRDVWDFAVEIQSLRRAGLTNSALRWMICNDWVKHARESPVADNGGRSFRRSGALTFGKRTCFVLTESGAESAKQVCDELPADGRLSCESSSQASQILPYGRGQEHVQLRPKWDAERHQLCLGEVLVKEFKLPSANQGTILMAFEEEEWPPRIDDPLPPSGEVDSKTRLRYTIKSLNKNQKSRLIRFMGDGTGEGIRWELIHR